MKNILFMNREKLKHVLYLISIFILLGLSILVFYHSAKSFLLLDYLKDILNEQHLSLMILCGSAFLLSALLFISKFLDLFSEKKLILISALLGVLAVCLQYFLLFKIEAVIRYDHLRVFDAGLEIMRTGKLSLSANNGYFGLYPFNISIAVFNSILLRILSFLGIPESFYLLSVQAIYLFFIDLGIFFSWQIVRMLYSVKHAAMFTVLCVCNPMFYVCIMGLYTTTLMLPLLMGAMFFIICFQRTADYGKKLQFGFLAGLSIAFGTRLRATVVICAIAWIIYLLVKKKEINTFKYNTKQIALLISMILLGSVIGFGGFTAFQNTYVHEDYHDTQMPPIYYLMFAMNPGSKGSYNEDDFLMISKYKTLEEKKEASIEVIKDRLEDYGVSGTLSLAKTKLTKTWSDGIEDFGDFLTTSRNYGTIQSYIGGVHKDFFALYAHIYHVAVMGMLCIAVILALFKKCDSSCYLILLTLLGGMIFHILWESFYYYSFGFTILFMIPAAESICFFSDKKCSAHTSGGLGMITLAGFLILLVPALKELSTAEYKHSDYAVVQDMSLGECEPLLSGQTITQTFVTDRPFNRIGCKTYNDTGSNNGSIYRMELLNSHGDVLAQREFTGAETADGDYCYLALDDIIPAESQTYTIRLTALHTTAAEHLMFGYYNTHQYDIYSDGHMSGLNSDERSDLTFMVLLSTTDSFFHELPF